MAFFSSVSDLAEFCYDYVIEKEESRKNSQSSSSASSKPTQVAAKSIPLLPPSGKKREVIDLTGTEPLTKWLDFSLQQAPVTGIASTATTYSNLPPPDLARGIQENQRKLDEIQKQANVLQEYYEVVGRIDKLKLDIEKSESILSELKSTTTMSDIDSSISDFSTSSMAAISLDEMEDDSIAPSSLIGILPTTIPEEESIDEDPLNGKVLEEIDKILDPRIRQIFIEKIKNPKLKTIGLCAEVGINRQRLTRPRDLLIRAFPYLENYLFDNH